MKLDHIVLAVSDLGRSVPYYDVLFELLGLTKTREHVYASEQGWAFDLRTAAEPTYAYRRSGVGVNHIAMAAVNRAQVDQVARSMAAAGFDVPETQVIGDAYALFMKDADGMRIEIVYEP